MTTQSAQPNPPLLNNRYRIVSRLGNTRLAQVYRAQDERLARSVLVHVLRPELEQDVVLSQRFVEEAQKMAQRTHPALLDVFDRGEVGARSYMVTEDLHGKPLTEVLPVSTDRGIQILRQIVGAVVTTLASDMQAPPIISDAILITAEGRTVLVEPWWLSQTELRDAMAYYRAPEIIEGGQISTRSLVYSLGMLGYELFLGRRPWSEYGPDKVQDQHVHADLPPLHSMMNDFMPSLSSSLSLATTRDLQRRTFDPQALARELAAVESSSQAITRQITRPVPAFRDSLREARKTITQRIRPEVSPPPNQAPSAWAAPPPPQAYAPRPVMPPPRAEVQAPAQSSSQAALSQKEIRKEVRREVQRYARRQGCLRFIRRRIVGLVLLAVLAFGCFWGFTVGRDWFTSGEAKIWACGYIPEFACEWLPGPSEIVQPKQFVVVSTGVNIRTQPIIAEDNVIDFLPANTPVVAPDPNDIRSGDGNQWIRVQVYYNNRQIDGWVALSYLQEE